MYSQGVFFLFLFNIFPFTNKKNCYISLAWQRPHYLDEEIAYVRAGSLETSRNAIRCSLCMESILFFACHKTET